MLRKIISISIIITILLSLALNCIAANTVIKKETLEKSIVKAADNVLSIQENDGRWAANIRINPRETAYFIVTAKYLKIPGLDEDIKKSADWLVQHVNNDNGWGFFDKGGKSDISITAIVYLALKLAGVDENSIVMKKSFAFIENNGGLKASDIFCKTFYSFFNLYKEPWDDPKSEIFFPPLEILYLKNSEENSIFSTMAWGREAGIALSVIKEYKKRENLYLKSNLISEAERWIVSHQLEDGCWYTLLGTCLNMIALNEINRDKHWPRIQKAMSWINNMREPDGYQKRFVLSVWDTAFCISALRMSQISSSEEPLLKAGKWIINAQTMGGGYNWSNVPSGGWSYNENNILYPDNDDTALAMSALSSITFNSYSMEYRKEMSLKLGEKWLLYMQNDDGGWGTFGRSDEKEYKVAPDATEDPSVADITGHVLSALGARGYNSDNPVIKKTVEYLKKDQNNQGAWYGRWGLCYLYGTSCTLIGLNDVGYNMKDPFVIKATEWLLSHQNSDGGWGEYFSSWDNQHGISYTEFGHSNAEQTAWGVLALIASDKEKYKEPIEKGINYLLSNQKENGGWDNTEYTVLGLNPYRNMYYPVYFPLLALSTYAKALGLKIETSGINGVERVEKETYRMIKDFPFTETDEFGGNVFTKPSFEIDFEKVDSRNTYALKIFNKSKEKVKDFKILVSDSVGGNEIAKYDFDKIDGEESIAKKIVLPSKPTSNEIKTKVVISYDFRGKKENIEKMFSLKIEKDELSNININNILSFIFLALFVAFIIFYIKKTNRELLKYSLKNLLRNKIRTSLAFLGIVIGIAATAGTISLGESFKGKLKNDFESFGAGRIIVLPKKLDISVGPPTKSFDKMPPLKINKEVIDELKDIENIKDICPIINYETTVSFKGEAVNCFIQFVDLKAFQNTSPLDIKEGAFLCEGDVMSANIGFDIANKAFSEKIKTTDMLKIDNYNIRVKGIFSETKGMSGRLESIVTPNIVIYLPHELASRFVQKDYYDALEIKVANLNEIKSTDKKINQMLEDLYQDKTFSTVYTEKLQGTVSGILDQFNKIITIIGLFCLLVSGIGIINMMIININERRREIGVFKALGAKRSIIVRIFFTELFALGFVSGLIGFIGGLVVVLITQVIARIYSPPNFLFLLENSILLGVIVVMVFGMFPVLRELKKEPIDSIKEN